MKNEIEKLIREYQQKIKDKEIQLDELNKLVTEYRHIPNMLGQVVELIAERALKESQKQAYVTAQKDFESLLDFVDAKTKNDTVDKETPPKAL